MSELWRRTVEQIDRLEPDREKLRAKALEGPRIGLEDHGVRPTGSRIIAALVAFVVFILGGSLVWQAFRGEPEGQPADADGRATLVESGGTYELSDFRVEYRPDGGSPVKVDFVSHWTSEEYPGEATCQIVVVDADGHPVGELEFGLSTLEPNGGRSREFPVDVNGVAVRASGACGPGMIARGSTYVFSNVVVDPAEGRIKATVGWSSDVPAGTAACIGAITTPEGTRLITEPFTLTIGSASAEVTPGIDQAVPEGSTGEILCEPYRHPEQTQPQYWDAATPVTMPNLVGLHIVDAIQLAEDAGLVVEAITITDDSKLGEPAADDVVAQDPAPGVEVEPGSSVRVTVTAIPHSKPSPAELDNSAADNGPGLSAADASRYESILLTNTTPAEAAERLRGKIAEFEAEAVAAETPEESAAQRDAAAYLAAILDLLCRQEESAGC
jgi:hypothetical protein